MLRLTKRASNSAGRASKRRDAKAGKVPVVVSGRAGAWSQIVAVVPDSALGLEFGLGLGLLCAADDSWICMGMDEIALPMRRLSSSAPNALPPQPPPTLVTSIPPESNGEGVGENSIGTKLLRRNINLSS